MLEQARAALADEWRQADPRTPDEIAGFYTTARGIGADLDAWHATPERQTWTDLIVHVARESGAQFVLDIGAGAGHDLLALRAAGGDLHLAGVEPNTRLGDALAAHGITVFVEAAFAPVERADLLVCIDVLEHVPDPERFLSSIAQRARIGCLLVEATASHDAGTPLHLAANRGWHPGRVLERHGWQLVDYTGRLRVWRRDAPAGGATSSLLLCAYRGVGAETMSAVLGLVDGGRSGWRVRTKYGDALIGRSRSILVSSWYRETNDDAFLMLDDDIALTPREACGMIALVRAGHDIVAAAYPVRGGAHLALRAWPTAEPVTFGPEEAPVEIQYAATGAMAVARRVIDALVRALPLCHPRESWSYWPCFQALLATDEHDEPIQLSEDWGFCHLARAAGCRVWLDPRARPTHYTQVPHSVVTMGAIHAASSQS